MSYSDELFNRLTKISAQPATSSYADLLFKKMSGEDVSNLTPATQKTPPPYQAEVDQAVKTYPHDKVRGAIERSDIEDKPGALSYLDSITKGINNVGIGFTKGLVNSPFRALGTPALSAYEALSGNKGASFETPFGKVESFGTQVDRNLANNKATGNETLGSTMSAYLQPTAFLLGDFALTGQMAKGLGNLLGPKILGLQKQADNLIKAPETIKLYRGEQAGTVGGNKYTSDQKWAGKFGEVGDPITLPKGSKIHALDLDDFEMGKAKGFQKTDDVANELFKTKGYDAVLKGDQNHLEVIVNPKHLASKSPNPLTLEARKYKSAEEFVNTKVGKFASENDQTIFQRHNLSQASTKQDFNNAIRAEQDRLTNKYGTVMPEISGLGKSGYNDLPDLENLRNKVVAGDYIPQTRSQLTDIWNKAKETGGGASLNTILGGAAATAGAGLSKLIKPRQITVTPKQEGVAQDTTPTSSIVEAIAHNETGVIPEGKKYSFSQPSGSKALGRALGKYQVTEGELKTYAKRYLGKVVSAKEFLKSPQLQDEYVKSKIEYLKEQGYSTEEILRAHRGGVNAKPHQYKEYVKKGLAYMNSL